MTKRIPGSMRTRESLLELVEGRLSAPDARTELVRLATRLIVEEALEDLAVEMFARGLSVRDIEDAFRNDKGELLLSRTAVSEIGERLWQDYQEFATRDLGGHDIACLFVDGVAERVRPGLGHDLRGEEGAAASDVGVEGGP